MGKGDRKTAKGKRYNASYGNARSHTASKVAVGAAARLPRRPWPRLRRRRPLRRRPSPRPDPADRPVHEERGAWRRVLCTFL